MEEKSSFSGMEKVKKNNNLICQYLFYNLLDKQEDPEDINVKYTRNLKTSASFSNSTEEHRGLLTSIHQEHQQPMAESTNNESTLIPIQSE